MDSGQPCNCNHCPGCDGEGYRREQFRKLEKKAYQVAHDDKLFEKEQENYSSFMSSGIYKQERESGYISAVSEGAGRVLFMAAAVRREEKFFKEHGRYQSIGEFLTGIFPNKEVHDTKD